MAILVKRFASRDQESIISDSSELGNELVADNGIETTINCLSKWVMTALFACIFLMRRDGAAMWAMIGSVSNSVLALALKRLFNQARPTTTEKSDPGMPSSHAQCISFTSVFAVLSVMEWFGTNQVSFLLSSFILALASYFIRLRVSQKLHTNSQVVVGAIVGSVFCILWYKTWNSHLLEAFESSLFVQLSVFLVSAACTLAFIAYVLLKWI